MERLEDKYIKLWQDNKDLLKQNTVSLMDSLRDQALHTLQSIGLPKYRSENYQRSNIDDILKADWNIDFCDDKKTIINVLECDLPDKSEMDHYTVVNNVVQEQKNYLSNFGGFAGSLKVFAEAYPDIAKKYYSKIANISKDGIVALNTLLLKEGFIVYVPKNTKIIRPIQILNIIDSDIMKMYNSRLIIIVEDGSAVNVIYCDNLLSDINVFTLNVVEIYAGKFSNIDITMIEETNKKCKNITSTYVHCEDNSSVCLNGLTLYNGFTRNNYFCDLVGENSNLVLSGLAIGTNKQHIDNYSYINHKVANCKCSELFKYILSDQSVGAFTGRIHVAKNSQKTEAYQNNKNLLLSRDSRMYSKPQLEIYADDVKCSHGMTTGQIDEDALFYMRQRGLSFSEAKLLLSIAFTEDVICTISLDSLKDRIRHIVESRFRNNETIHCTCKQ